MCQGLGPPLVLDRNVTGPLLSGGAWRYPAGSGFDSQLRHLPAMMMILGWGLNLPELSFLICKMGLMRMNGKIPNGRHSGHCLKQNNNEAIVAVLLAEVSVAGTEQALHKCLRMLLNGKRDGYSESLSNFPKVTPPETAPTEVGKVSLRFNDEPFGLQHLLRGLL